MTNRVNGVEAAETMQQIYAFAGIARLVSVDDCRNVRDSIGRYDAVMPILDPTSYRDTITGENHEANREILRAFMTFRSELERIIDRHPHLAASAGGAE